MISFKNSITKIKINRIGANFWIQPSILTFSRRKYAARPYKTFKKLLKNEALINENFIFTFNSDNDLDMFRRAQEIKEIPFFFNRSQILLLEKNGYIDYEIKNTFITIRYDKKSLKELKKGYTPFFSPTWLKDNFRSKKNITIVWRKNGYTQIK